MSDQPTSTFSVLRASDPAERAAWVALWNLWDEREVFAHPAYVERFIGEGDEVLCATLKASDCFVMYPFIKRCIPGTYDRYDITSAYGYGGPFISNVSATSLADPFWSAFDDWVSKSFVVSEFIRFGLFVNGMLPYPGDRRERLQNVVRSLTPDEQDLWYDFEHKVRKNVQKAQRSGITIEVDPAAERLEDFLRIYYGTMERRAAAHGYYYPRKFFEALVSELPNSAVFFHALQNGVVVSSELVLVSAKACYSFLGGTEESAFAFRPNDALKFEVIKWARKKGLASFVFGGGAALDDGIFRYKRAFAPTGVVPFFTGTRIFDQVAYDALVAARQILKDRRSVDTSDGGYFPAYRAP